MEENTKIVFVHLEFKMTHQVPQNIVLQRLKQKAVNYLTGKPVYFIKAFELYVLE